MYDEALSLEPQNTYALLQLARARIMVDPPQLDEALSNVNSIIGLENLNGNAWKLKGDIHTMMKDYEAAEKALIQAVGMSQGDARFEAQQSLAYVRRSKPGSSTTIPTQSSDQFGTTELPSPTPLARTPATLPNVAITPLLGSPSTLPQLQSQEQLQTSRTVPISRQPQPPNYQTHPPSSSMATSTTPASSNFPASPGASPTPAMAATGSACEYF